MKSIKFLRSINNLKDLPSKEYPEVVLCGRSNVGKSSFINNLFNKKGIAKTSSTPGKTRSINYYLVEDKFYMVDLPGFGYAKVSKTERDAWQKLLEDFLQSNRNISTAFHFIDSRHNPTSLDILLNEFLRDLEIPYIVVLNKIDKLKQSELAKTKKNIINTFPELIPGENLILHSAVKGLGKKEVQSLLTRLYF